MKIKIIKVSRKNGKAVEVVALIDNCIEICWRRREDNDKIYVVRRVKYGIQTLDRGSTWIPEEVYKKLKEIVSAIFKEDRSK